MAVESVDIKYKIPRVVFQKGAPTNQSFKLEMKKQSDINYTLVSSNFITDGQGRNINNIHLTGLDSDTLYEIRLTHLKTNQVFNQQFRTAVNFIPGESPLWMKKLYPGQTIDFYVDGLLASSLPPNYTGFYYILEQNFRDAFEGFSNAEPKQGSGFKTLENTVNAKKYTGAYFNGTRYVAMNNTHPNAASRVNAEQMFGSDGSRDYSIFVWFYNESGTDKPILTTGNTTNNFRVMLEGGVVKVTTTKNSVSEVSTAASPITNNNWYLLEVRRNPNNPNYGVVFLHSDAGTIPFDNYFAIAMNGQASDNVYLGYDNINTEVASGLAVRRFYYAVNSNLDNNTRYRLISPDDYLPKLVFQNSSNAEFVVPTSWQLKLDNSVFSTVVMPTLPVGEYDMFIRTPTNDIEHKDVEVVVFQKDTVGFDIDFTEDFDSAVALFKDKFYALHNQWGGQNGGVNSNLIYADRGAQTLVFENHGDNYVGEIAGVQKPPKNSNNQGYGYKKTHDIPADPKLGQDWKTRVGAVAVSAEYAGYGEWSTWMKVPVGTYGVAPALWFFHYQELYPTDERWQFWIDKGGKPYGGGDPYMVINHEIDMELPSHLAMGVFAEWNQVSLTYFDPLALDTQYHIAVEDGSNQANYGLFRLTNPTLPNLKSSWVKVANTWDIVSTPKFSNVKFNNWIGEKSAGNGWAYTEEEYEGEEYLALLTQMSTNYADDQFHKWTIKWYKDRTELWVDDVFIRANKAFVPYIPGRITLGAWFPSAVSGDSTEPWKYSPARAWAGHPADFDTLNIEINRIQFIPFDNATAGGDNEYFSETYPEAGLINFL